MTMLGKYRAYRSPDEYDMNGAIHDRKKLHTLFSRWSVGDGPCQLIRTSPTLSSFSGNSIVSLTVWVKAGWLAVEVSKNGRFQPFGRGPWF